MKKFVKFVLVNAMFLFTASALFAQDASGGGLSELHNAFREKFIEGGVFWMTPILFVLILGLAISIERIIYLNLATVNVDKLLKKIDEAFNTGGVDAAKEVCRSTRGPIASIFYQAFERYDQGLEDVEKAIVSFGGVQMGFLEKGMVWLQFFIAIAPSLGFLGTVIGMVMAFDAIAQVGDISPSVVAGGMMVALLTTVFGLIAAMILQLFYNYLLAKISSMTQEMEESAISIMDMMIRYQTQK
jgi:biopolymer transport protein ExbB